jgi:hypothetical protein
MKINGKEVTAKKFALRVATKFISLTPQRRRHKP